MVGEFWRISILKLLYPAVAIESPIIFSDDRALSYWNGDLIITNMGNIQTSLGASRFHDPKVSSGFIMQENGTAFSWCRSMPGAHWWAKTKGMQDLSYLFSVCSSALFQASAYGDWWRPKSAYENNPVITYSSPSSLSGKYQYIPTNPGSGAMKRQGIKGQSKW